MWWHTPVIPTPVIPTPGWRKRIKHSRPACTSSDLSLIENQKGNWKEQEAKEKKLLQKHRRHILVPAVLKVSVNRKLDRIHSHLGDGLLGLLGGGIILVSWTDVWRSILVRGGTIPWAGDLEYERRGGCEQQPVSPDVSDYGSNANSCPGSCILNSHDGLDLELSAANKLFSQKSLLSVHFIRAVGKEPRWSPQRRALSTAGCFSSCTAAAVAHSVFWGFSFTHCC